MMHRLEERSREVVVRAAADAAFEVRDDARALGLGEDAIEMLPEAADDLLTLGARDRGANARCRAGS